jgi:polyisoprenoid-binding protein YceI
MLGVAIFAVPSAVLADTWHIDLRNSSAQFSLRHMGISTVRGAFTKLSGTVEYNPSELSKTSVAVTIDAASIDTHEETRDTHLRSPDFFDVAKYPTLTFKSTRVESAGEGKLRVTGDFTMHGTTRTVVLDIEGPSDPIKDPRGDARMGASATTKINRQDYGVSGGGAMVGDEISITIDVELEKGAGGH